MDFLQRAGNPYLELMEPNQQTPNTTPNIPAGFQAGDASHLSLNTRGKPSGPPDPNIAHVHEALACQGMSDVRLQQQFENVQTQQTGTFQTQPGPNSNPHQPCNEPVRASDPQTSNVAGTHGTAMGDGS